MDEISTEVIPLFVDHLQVQLGIARLTEIVDQVRSDNRAAFEGCKTVIMQQKIAAGTYCVSKKAL